MTDAHYAYGRWGATAKVEELASQILVEESAAPPAGRAAQIDVLAVVRASQAISTEILLSKLVHSLMRIVIEQAGAERGSLLLMRQGQLWVEGVAGAAVESARFVRRPLGAAAPGETPLLPHAILDYVRRTQEKVLLADAGKDNIFSTDPYLHQSRPRSVLCLPMMRQAELIGMLYLENRLTGDACSPDRVAVLEVLSSQAAISIENATLYEDMEQRIAARTRDLEAKRGLVLVIGAVQEDHVKVRVETEVRRGALHDGDRARLRAERAAGRRTLHVERVHALDEDAGEGREQRAVMRKPAPPRERERHHPLAERGLREHVLDEVGCGAAHASAEARRAESAALTAKRDEPTLVARAAPKPREAAAE
jgi:GAF domain-containing protein